MRKKNSDKKKLRIRYRIKSVNNGKLRISISRSKKNISAQIIDDNNSSTLVAASSLDKQLKLKGIKKKSDQLIAVAELLANRANEKKLNNFYFDRGKFIFLNYRKYLCNKNLCSHHVFFHLNYRNCFHLIRIIANNKFTTSWEFHRTIPMPY